MKLHQKSHGKSRKIKTHGKRKRFQENIDYAAINGLATEAKQKLQKIQTKKQLTQASPESSRK